MTAVAELQELVAGIAEKVGPSVVGIGRGWGVGSGVVLGEGAVLTAAHAVRRGEIGVSFADGRRETGELRGTDARSGLAVIGVETGGAPAPDWEADAGPVRIGAPVVALADPGGRGLRATLGQVSTAQRAFRGPRGRRLAGAVEHTAPLPRGSSGGPLVDLEGRVLGINAVRLEGGLILAAGVDGAVRGRLDALRRGDAAATPRLGVAVAPPHLARRLRRAVGLPDESGVLVRAVQEDSPAARAGLERGDLIVAAGGAPVDTADTLQDRLAAAEATLALEAVRGTDRRTLEVALR